MARDIFIHGKKGPGLLAEACDLLQGMLGLVAARNANWEIVDGWCSACSRLGAALHGSDPDRCECVCHQARKFIAEHQKKPGTDAV